MRLFLSLVLSTAASFRCAGHVLELVVSYLPRAFSLSSSPSWSCGRLWLLRVGYYKLSRPKTIADDWVWIVDHTIQVGQEKCLVILGIRQCNLPSPFRSLRHEDMEPLALIPVTESNGEIVYQQLEETSMLSGVPRQIVADEGADLHKGIRRFSQEHPGSVCTYDIKHKTAAVLRHELEHDEQWKRFASLAAYTKQKLQQTRFACLAPRRQRRKARYMNVDHLIRWGEDLLGFLASNRPGGRGEGEGKRFEAWQQLLEKVGWLEEFTDQLKEWGEVMRIIATTEHFVRTEGLYRGAYQALAARLSGIGCQSQRAKKVGSGLLCFVAEESFKAKPGERLVGSSEVLESVFGKLKYLEGEQAKSGFTGLLLSIPAMVSRTTGDVIHQAMERVSTKKVLDWCKKYIGKSLQAKRRGAFKVQDKSEQKWDQLRYAA